MMLETVCWNAQKKANSNRATISELHLLTTPMQQPTISIYTSIWLKHYFHKTGHSVSY